MPDMVCISPHAFMSLPQKLRFKFFGARLNVPSDILVQFYNRVSFYLYIFFCGSLCKKKKNSQGMISGKLAGNKSYQAYTTTNTFPNRPWMVLLHGSNGDLMKNTRIVSSCQSFGKLIVYLLHACFRVLSVLEKLFILFCLNARHTIHQVQAFVYAP
jgi:hypothetical protein